jgi:Protein of unknown function (DUF2892)
MSPRAGSIAAMSAAEQVEHATSGFEEVTLSIMSNTLSITIIGEDWRLHVDLHQFLARSTGLVSQFSKQEVSMSTNVGNADRVIRVIIGLALISYAWFYPSAPLSWLGWIGLLPILTAAFGTCPLYSLIGVNTCNVKLPRSQ